MMKIKFNDHYTSITKYGGTAEGYKFIAEVLYSGYDQKWTVADIRWIFNSFPKKKDKAEKRIRKMVKEFFQRDNDAEEVSSLYERIFKEESE